jgi:hypothetical protein
MMLDLRHARESARHVVDMPCELVTESCDEPILAWATDMSADGAWFDTREPLALGASLVVCIKPGVWWRSKELMVFAEVARISRGMRGGDDVAGMGVSFLDIARSERFALRSWLRPRPERMPRRRLPKRVVDVARRRYERALPIPEPATVGTELRFPMIPPPRREASLLAPPERPREPPMPTFDFAMPQSPFASRIG